MMIPLELLRSAGEYQGQESHDPPTTNNLKLDLSLATYLRRGLVRYCHRRLDNAVSKHHEPLALGVRVWGRLSVPW